MSGIKEPPDGSEGSSRNRNHERVMIEGMPTLFDDDTTLPPATPPKPTRKPNDPVWDALAEWFGSPATRTEQRLRGRIVASLVEAGATPHLIHERCLAWENLFPGATLTATALEKHWTQLGMQPLRGVEAFARRGHESCPECHGSGIIQTYSPGAGMVSTPCTKGTT